jgi:hypothetical protein
MRVLTFQDQFVEKIRDDSKTQTIRRKALCRPGDMLSLRRWTGRPYHSKQEIIKEVVCLSVVKIYLSKENSVILPKNIAIDDGFSGTEAMIAWFETVHGLPFYGEVIKW